MNFFHQSNIAINFEAVFISDVMSILNDADINSVAMYNVQNE